MLKTLIDDYQAFHDAMISEVVYTRNQGDTGSIKIIMRAWNCRKLIFEQIEINLVGIKSFRLIERFPYSSLIIIAAVIVEESDESITLDFFPDIYSDKLVINEESDFIVRCTNISYKLI